MALLEQQAGIYPTNCDYMVFRRCYARVAPVASSLTDSSKVWVNKQIICRNIVSGKIVAYPTMYVSEERVNLQVQAKSQAAY